ncbi:15624_t:CDS:2 [Funneliformis geosporum]|uniref:4222_t:CDS:1 n=1 Tax=Funneliformis geosporum TaxID=1117311 RepID=A0A9W4SQ94_9GLOM|nr:15624_t:CDS:2 [Funneliformis geosporum]CAI2176548.1 4222_t:CDS:2 [Funneliformis geosporum]
MNQELANNQAILTEEPSTTPLETGLNQKFFKEVIESSQLSEEKDKSKIQTYEELGQKPNEVQTKFNNLEEEYNTFKQKSEEQIQELTNRSEQAENKLKEPDIAITEQQFLDDYAKREKKTQSKLKEEELTKEKEKVKNLAEKNRKLFFAVNSYLKAIRTKKYTLMKPVKTIKQAREAIAELLEETERG